MLFEPFRQKRILARQIMRHEMRIASAVLVERCRTGFEPQLRIDVQLMRRRLNKRFFEINRIVDDLGGDEQVAMPREIFGHGKHVAGLRTTALEVTVLEVRRRDNEGVPCPFPRRKTRPCVVPTPVDAGARRGKSRGPVTATIECDTP